MLDSAPPPDALATQLAQTSALIARGKAVGLPAAQTARAARKASTPRLTAAQRRRVRELVEDEGESRASAIAWVLAMEPAS